MDASMFWVKLDPLAKDGHSPQVPAFLRAPDDYRLGLGYLKPWKKCDSELYGFFENGLEEGAYTKRLELSSVPEKENIFMQLKDFLEVATEPRYSHAHFSIRDNDLRGRNRLYDTCMGNSPREYRDGASPHSRLPDSLFTETDMNVQIVKWKKSNGWLVGNPPPTPAPAPWRRIW
jgi:hypothetical protein